MVSREPSPLKTLFPNVLSPLPNLAFLNEVQDEKAPSSIETHELGIVIFSKDEAL